jgi:release factor glutamine methyltransferase
MVNRLKAAGIEDAELALRFLREDGKCTEENVERLIDGEPLQYILENWEFYGLPMQVRKGVLIPRPDTEILVDTAIAFLKTRTDPVFLDLGCGSGAITVATAKHTGARAMALDNNPLAIALTRENAKLCGVDVQVIEGDLFSFTPPPVDAVISNPPYLDGQEMTELSVQVQKEPVSALFGGEDGLDYYRFIAPTYAPFLKAGGALIFEIGYRQGAAVAAICEAAGYRDIQIIKDYGGNDRVVYCRR